MDRLLLFPLLIPLALLLVGNDAFGFDPPGWVDSFMYVGYFWHYPEHLWVFDDNSSYKISRLPWILPGFAAHSLFGPVGASYFLAYLSMAASAVALYLLVRDALDDRLSAVTVSIAWACCTWVHGIGGWSYHMVAASAYYLLGCWLLVRAARASKPGWWGAMAGVCIAAAVHTHLFLVAFLPLLALLFWSTVPPTSGVFDRLVRVGSVALCGSVAVTLLLAVVNRLTGGAWAFFMPQIEQALRLLEPAYDSWWQGNMTSWLPSARYLVIPLAFLVAGLAVPFRSGARRRPAIMLVALGWGALAIMCFFQFVRRQTTLDYSYMAFALYLHAFPCMGAVLAHAGRDTRHPVLTAGIVTSVVLGTLLLLLPTPLPGMMQTITSVQALGVAPIVAPLVVGLIGAAAMMWVPRPAVVIAFALWFALVNAWIAPAPSAYGVATSGYRQEMLSMFREADRFTTALDPTLIGIKYWMSDEEIVSRHGMIPLRTVFDSFVATRAWFTNLVGRVVPSPSIDQLTLADLERGRCLGVLSSVRSQRALKAAMEAHFASLGRPLEQVASNGFEGRDLAFALTVLRPAPEMRRSSSHGESQPCRQPTASDARP